MNNCLVSIIVPVYNVPHEMLIKCLDSIEHQSYKKIEVIVVNDGSTDLRCKDICASYKTKKRFKIFDKKNGGLCDARNFGVDKATGDWITFVDGDDYLTSDCIENIVRKIILNTNIDIVCFGTIKEYKNSKFNYDYKNIFIENKIYSNNLLLLKYLLDFNSNIGDVTAKFYKRDFLKQNKLAHDITIKQGVEAIDFNFNCFELCNGLQFIKYYGYNYVYNDKSITLTISKNNIDLLLKGIDKLYLDLQNSKYNKELENELDTRINYVIVTTVVSGIFAPNNKVNNIEKKQMMNLLMNNDKVLRAINNKNVILDIKRRIIIFLIKKNCYLLLKLIAKTRRIQKEKF